MKNSKSLFVYIIFSFIFMNTAFSTNLNGTFTMQQKSNGRYLDAYDYDGTDYNVVSRAKQGNDTQNWVFRKVGPNTYTIQQKSTRRYLDAHTSQGHDYSLVTRTAQNNNTQKWIIEYVGPNSYTIQQKSNGRYMDAHTSQNHDFSVVTRTAQNNDTQRWIIKRVSPPRRSLSLVNKIVKASIFGAGIKGKKIFGHTFNFSQNTSVKVNHRTGVKTVYVKIVHSKRLRPDDNYYFKATFSKNDKLLTWKYKINRGGFLPRLASSSVSAGRFEKTAKGLSRADVDRLKVKAQRKLGRNCSWENAAKEIAMIIARTAVSYK